VADAGTHIHIEIDDELHRRLNSEAALRGLTLKAYLIEVLSEAVADETADARGRREPFLEG